MQFPLIPMNSSPPTGNAFIDQKFEKLSLVYGFMARIRMLICARANLMMTSGVYLAETQRYWKKHDNLLKVAEGLRELLSDHGVDAPPVPDCFYVKF